MNLAESLPNIGFVDQIQMDPAEFGLVHDGAGGEFQRCGKADLAGQQSGLVFGARHTAGRHRQGERRKDLAGFVRG